MGFWDFIKPKETLAKSGVLQGKTDRHSHILFGVDDGIKTLEDSIAVLDIEAAAGVVDVWCTPHIMEDVPSSTDSLKERFAQLEAAYKGPVRLHLAAEYMLDTLFERRLEAQDLLTMDDNTVLVETSTWNPPTDMTGMLEKIQRAGYNPLLAHPERYRYLDVKGCETLYRMGVRFQLNIPSLTGHYGENVKKKAIDLLEKGWYSEIGSDCHRLLSIEEQYNRDTLTKRVLSLL